MGLYFNHSPLSTVFLVPLDEVQDPSYHHKHFGKFLFRDRARSFESQKEFFQPVQLNQMITIQYEENWNPAGGWPILNILDYRGELIVSFATSYAVTALAGNKAPDGSQLYSHQWQFVPDAIGLDEGIYQLHLVTGSTADDDEFISEPLDIKEDHPDTLYIEYNHDRNEYDTVFDLNPNFCFRVPGCILRDNPEADTTNFDDQIKELTLLNAVPFRTTKIGIGAPNGVPDWVTDRLNWILGCSAIRIEDKVYGRESNAKMDIVEVDGSPLVGALISIREDNPSSPFQHKSKKVKLFEIPEDEYFIYELKVIWGIFIRNFTITSKGAIFSGGDLDDYIDDVNNTVVIPNNMTGEVVEDDGVVYYINGPGEDWQINSSIILTKFILETVNVSNAAHAFEFTQQQGKVGVSWGDTTVNRYQGNGSFLIRTKTYGSTGDKTVYIFHDNVMTAFYNLGLNSTKVTDVAGNCPTGLLQFALNNQNVAIFDWSILHPCHNVITFVNLASSQVEEFTNLIFNPTGPDSFAPLNTIDLHGNKILTADLDAFILAMWNDMNYVGSGFLFIQGQTPAAPPNTAATAYIDIDNAGWTITHD